jgi:hypothetical protein
MPKLPDARQATCWQNPFPPTNKPARSVARRNYGVCRLSLVVAWDVYFGQLAAQDRYAASVADIDQTIDIVVRHPGLGERPGGCRRKGGSLYPL